VRFSGSHGGKYEHDSLLGYNIILSRWSRLMFQRCVLPPSSGQWCHLQKILNYYKKLFKNSIKMWNYVASCKELEWLKLKFNSIYIILIMMALTIWWAWSDVHISNFPLVTWHAHFCLLGWYPLLPFVIW
jgi:hypothetical protein